MPATAAGFRRCQGDDHDVVEFESWCPKAIAQIRLPRWATIVDRSVVVVLQRKRHGDSVQKFRKSKPPPELHAVLRRAARWADDVKDLLPQVEAELPEWFDNRQADNWEPLLQIAQLVSPEAAAEARAAAELLAQDDDGLEVRLLRDLREAVFEPEDGLHIEETTTEVIVQTLVGLEERPWATITKGKPLTAHRLGRMLGPFGISSVKVELNGASQKRGYRRAQFEPLWERYLSPLVLVSEASEASEPETPSDTSDASDSRTEREKEDVHPDPHDDYTLGGLF
jgi:hypothetical protein